MPLTPETRALLEALDRARLEAGERLVAEDEKAAAIQMFREVAFWQEWLKGDAALTAAPRERIVRTMNVDTTRHPSDVKRGATRARRKHPAQKKLYEQGMTIASLAKALGETRSRVSSWMADGEALRPIPAGIAEKLREKYGIPLSVWRRVSE